MMDKQDWAPEPWEMVFVPRHFAPEIKDSVIHDAKDKILFYPHDLKKTEANVRRIIACVNACAGMPTKDLPSSFQHLLRQLGCNDG